MGLDKNFVVRNGLEIASDLVFADSVVNKAGIGTTTPEAKLDVNGNLNVVEGARIGGIATVEGKFGVGYGDTAFQVNPGSGRIGINTNIPEYNLDVIGDTGISSHLSVGGITTSGILHVTGLTSSVHLNVTGVTTIADARINTGFTTVTYSEAQYLNVTGVGTAVTLNATDLTVSNTAGIATANVTSKLNVSGVSTFTGNITVDGGNLSLGDNDKLRFGDSDDLEIRHTGAHSIIEEKGEGNLYLQSTAGSVYIRTNTNEAAIQCDQDASVKLFYDGVIKLNTKDTGVDVTGTFETGKLDVRSNVTIAGISTVGVITGSPSLGVGDVYAIKYFGDGSNLTGIDTSGNFQGKTIVCENVLSSNPGVGTFGSVVINNPAGRITATEFYGDGANLTNTGSTLSAASGTERVVFTNLTTGTMTASSTDADVTFDSTNSQLLLGTDKITLDASSGAATFAGNVFSGSGTGYVQNYAAGQISTRYDGDPDVGGGLQILSGGDLATNRVTWLKNNGSAEFADTATANKLVSKTYVTVEDNGSDSGLYVYGSGNSVVSSLNRTGGGTFSSTVQVGGNPFPGTATGFAAYIDGSIALSSATGTGTIFFGYTTGSSTIRSQILGNGTFISNRFTNVVSMLSANVGGTEYGYALTDSSSNLKAGIAGDGSAAFANSAAGAYTFISHKPAATAFCISGGDVNNTGAPKWYVTTGGAATFTGITGNLIGNASTSSNCNGNAASSTNSSNATNATNSTNIRVDTDESSNATRYIPFVASGGGAVQRRLYADSGMTWNPATNTLTATTFSGNATSASNATNAGKLDGYDSSQSATGNTVAVRDASGHLTVNDLNCDYVQISHTQTNRNSDTVFYSGPSGNNYQYRTTASGMRSSLNVPTRTGGDASGTWSISISGNASTSSNCNGNAATSSNTNGNAATVTINNSDSNGNYYMLWHSGNTVYKTNGIYCNPAYNYLYASTFIGALSGNASTSSNCNGNASTSTNCNGNAATSSNCNGSAASASNANYANSAGSSSNCNGNSATVTINYNNDSNSSYQMLWGSSNGVYGTGGITCNPYSDSISATSFNATNWFYSSGATGWYNNSYGGGIYMEDTTWVRVYNSKSFYSPGQILSDDNITAYSDIKFKEDIKVIPNALDKVKQIRGVTYLRKDREEGDETRKAGVIAQEVEKVLPEVVIDQENGKSVAYGNMVSLLIEAIKEQQVQIEELKSKINN